MDEPGGHYAKRNKPDTERETLHDLRCRILNKLLETESKKVVARGR